MGNRPTDENKILSLGDLVIDENGFIEFPIPAIDDGKYRVLFSKIEELDEVTTVEKRPRVTNGDNIKVRANIGSNNDLFLMRIKRTNNTLLRYNKNVIDYTWFRFRLVTPFVSIQNTEQVIQLGDQENGFESISATTAIFTQKLPSDTWIIPRIGISDKFKIVSVVSFGKESLLGRHGNHFTTQENNFNINLILPSYGKVYLSIF